MSELIVTRQHMLTVPHFTTRRGFCRNGARAWFDRHGLDMRTFMRDGLPASTLEATGCGFALALVRWARECESTDVGARPARDPATTAAEDTPHGR